MLFKNDNNLCAVGNDAFLNKQNYKESNWVKGNISKSPEYFMVDTEPHQQKVHPKLQVGKFVVTSVGLIMQKRA